MTNILYLSIAVIFLLPIIYFGIWKLVSLDYGSILIKKKLILGQKTTFNKESLVFQNIKKDGKYSCESFIGLNLKKFFTKVENGQIFDYKGCQVNHLTDRPFLSSLKFKLPYFNRKYSDVYLSPSYYLQDYIENVVMLN